MAVLVDDDKFRITGAVLDHGTASRSGDGVSSELPAREPVKSHANGTEPWSAQQRSERRRCGIDLIVMGASRKGAQLFDKGLVPGTFQKFDKTMLALRGKRVGAELL